MVQPVFDNIFHAFFRKPHFAYHRHETLAVLDRQGRHIYRRGGPTARRHEPTLLVTTRGFRDALRVAHQNRPRLFDRRILLPERLYSAVVEAGERRCARGEVLLK